jgi:hypothetical protein
MNLEPERASIETLVEGAPAALHLEFSPLCLGSTPKWASAPTPTSIGTFGVSREVGIEFSPMWRGCEGDPLCAVTRVSIGHLVDN